MIAIDHRAKQNLVTVNVLGEFTLADFKEFEALAQDMLTSGGLLNLLFDLREMASFTLDMAWEEIRFSRAHRGDFKRIAVVTDSQWQTWSAWLEQLFVSADLRVFDSDTEALLWVTDTSE